MLIKNDIIVILGPTASGKTELAVKLAKKIDAEIISADSRQVYKNMDIGTGKDLMLYQTENIKYHLIDICEAGQKYNLAQFQLDFIAKYTEIKNRNKNVILCGGSGLYIQAVLADFKNTDMQPDLALRSDLASKSREELLLIFGENTINADISTNKRLIRAIEIKKQQLSFTKTKQSLNLNYLIFGLNPDLQLRRKRISERLKHRFENGMLEEVKNLMTLGISKENLIYYGLEYKYITYYLIGELSYDAMFSKLETEIHRYAKRQMTFFRSMQSKGFKINWIDDTLTLSEMLNFIINEN